jgi:tetratricopeptide (TPR) repeat protein
MKSKVTSSAAAILCLTLSWTAFGAGGGSMPSGSMAEPMRPAATPEEQARDAYNAGVRGIEKGDDFLADASRQTDVRKQQKLRDKAGDAYASALKRFTRATELQPGMFEAWNYRGYASRKLGRHEVALAAYDRALSLKPDYAQAIEYRGHAYLGLGRLQEAQQAYLNLFASNRKLAGTLLAAMQQWLGEHRGAAGVDPASYEAFAAWVNERNSIAMQTAGLTREGAAAAWR